MCIRDSIYYYQKMVYSKSNSVLVHCLVNYNVNFQTAVRLLLQFEVVFLFLQIFAATVVVAPGPARSHFKFYIVFELDCGLKVNLYLMNLTSLSLFD